MPDIVFSIVFFTAVLVGFATSFMVLFSKKNYTTNFFLGLFIFSLATVSIYNFYLTANVFKDFPDCLIITKSFVYLIAPTSFLYVRSVLFTTKKAFRKNDWLHFLPFLFYFVFTLIVWAGNNFDFLIAPFLVNITKSPFSMLGLMFWFTYAFCQTIMILNYDLKKSNLETLSKEKILNWIRHYNLMILLLFSSLLVYYSLTSKTEETDFISYTLISIVLIVTVGWLYFKPQLFYDDSFEIFSFIKDDSTFNKTTEDKNELSVIKELVPEKKDEYLKELENVFSKKKLFLKKDFVIRDLSEETGISIHQLSNLINSEFNLHFKDYINLKRIEYFNNKINDPEWKDLSLEGMAWGAGFKSRTTCFRAFIKHTGKSPSEYFKNKKSSSDKIKFMENEILKVKM